MKRKLLPLVIMATKYLIYSCLIQAAFATVLLANDVIAQKYQSVSQAHLVTEYEGMSVIDVLRSIEKESQFKFNYDIKDIDKDVSINMPLKKYSIAEILKEVSKEALLHFKQINNNIDVKKIRRGQLNASKLEIILFKGISGKVTAEDGEGLPGVNILVKGTTVGTITDAEGSYQLDIPDDATTLIFSFVGYLTEEIEIGDRTVVNVTMTPDINQLTEVIVIGYGTQSKESLTGSVETVGAEKLQQVPLPSFEQTLQGNVAGLQAVVNNGQPGADVQVRIRGIGSITASSEPLYVIDGIPVQTGDITRLNETANTMSGINPNDIETVTVLKDASATAIYGSRGANGVILITTKSGGKGKAKIDIRSQVGFNSVAQDNILQPLNREQYTELYLEGWMNRGETLAQAQARFDNDFPQPGVDTDWLDAITRTGINQSYDLSASGGTDALTYFASGSYFKQESHIIGSQMERFSSRLNLSLNLTDKLKVTNNITVSNVDQQGFSDGTAWANPMYNALLLAPTIPIRDDQGRFYGDHRNFFMGGNNPVGSLSGDDTREFDQLRIIDNISAEYEIVQGLKLKTAWSVDFIRINEFFFRNGRYGDGRNVGGRGQESRISDFNWIGTQTATWGKTFNEAHNVDVLVGYEAQKSNRDRVLAVGEGYPNPTLRTLASAANPTTASSDRSEYSFSSLFSRFNYDFKNKYYASFSIRRDGSSRFGSNSRYGTFWSVGGSWRLNQEDFLSNVSFISDLRLRTSYGVTGNAALGNFPSVGLYAFGADYDGVPGSRPSQIGNPELTWETQENFNVGLDFGLFGGKVSGILEYFNRVSSDLLLDVPISSTTGFTGLLQNFGEMKNSGWEITLNADVINKGDFVWNTGFNITFLKNEVTKLNEEFIDGSKLRRQGEDFQSFYMWEWAGVNPDDGAPLWYTDSTRTETTSNISEAERFLIGKSATPDFFGGFNNTLSYKGLSLSFQFNYSIGNYVYDATAWVIQGDGRFTPRSQSTLVLDRWQQPGDITNVPRFSWGNRSSSNQRNSTRYLYDASHIRLRNITLSYNLPSTLTDKLNLRSLRVYSTATNLWTWTRDGDLYLDPEQQINGVANGVVPNVKTIAFGIDIGL
ncbi:TonB-dependent receptor [Fulvivirgaceae bacterium BMA10]|uniref:TonB-dependent receptor n=1 Tax=Splendidivirga corallicola TaxID=3051826 RepID=A0ABT8KI01_9BACT|nr:TonB-dependent receptor [Fulvivirgaceae bacterium BMA10]